MIEKKVIKGKKGKTIIYSIPITVAEIKNGINISWDKFTFYSPAGDFIVGNFSYDITRDVLDKFVFINILNINNEVIVEIDVIFDDKRYTKHIGLEGDMVLSIYVPSDINKEMKGIYKEVIDENQRKYNWR